MKNTKQCEAIWDCHGGNGTVQMGERCDQDAIDQRNGGYVCWLHRHACDNAKRAKPVRFIYESLSS